MAKSTRKLFFKVPKSKRKAKRQREVRYLLEVGTLESMSAAKQRTQDLLDYNWTYFSDLAKQRNQKIEEIKKALISSCISDFKFENWQRAVKYKYSLHPLSTVGSLSFIGGRFNAGLDVNVNVPSHPALYLAADKDTALQETLGQQDGQHSELTAQEIALTNPQSQTIVSVSGQLDKLFDLRSAKHLRQLMLILKHFEISDGLVKRAKELSLDAPNIIQTGKQLLDTVLNKNWRDFPVNLEVPSNSQIFGHLLLISGIDGVVYPSKFTGKDCVALFPQNFEGGTSFIKLDGDAPHKKVPNRIDGLNWRLCDVNFDDISGEGSTLQ
jgi:hypothetical protein